ncbi:MAG TPA: hypothetical protein VF043_15220 [Ktedonobacteraceae bacterium]
MGVIENLLDERITLSPFIPPQHPSGDHVLEKFALYNVVACSGIVGRMDRLPGSIVQPGLINHRGDPCGLHR